MTNNEIDLMEIIKFSIDYKLQCSNWRNEDIAFWLDEISKTVSEEFLNEIYSLRNQYLGLDD